MSEGTILIYITDKKGRKFFKELVQKDYLISAKRDLQRYLDNAKKYPKHHLFLDVETARIETETL